MHVKPCPSQRSPDEPDKRATPRGGARSTAAGRQKKFRQRPTLPHGNRAVPSALEGLTAVFGMGTGGTPPIKPPESLGDAVGCQPVRWNDWRPIKPPETFAYGQATWRRGRHCAALDPGLLQISVKQLQERNDQ